MKYDATTRTLRLEPKDCTTCAYGAGGRGEYTGSKICEVCNGTGRGPRGGRGGCRSCYNGRQHDFDNPIVCPSCNGTWQGAAMENFCDRPPAEAVESIPMFFIALGRDNTWNENYLGLGTIYSCTDYGTRFLTWAGQPDKDAADDVAQALMMEAREHFAKEVPQATKVLKKYERGDKVATLHDALIFVLTQTGYNVRAMSDLPENFRENSVAEKVHA